MHVDRSISASSADTVPSYFVYCEHNPKIFDLEAVNRTAVT
jgi:hypothetical protein